MKLKDLPTPTAFLSPDDVLRLVNALPDDEVFSSLELRERFHVSEKLLQRVAPRAGENCQKVNAGARYWGSKKAIAQLRKRMGVA